MKSRVLLVLLLFSKASRAQLNFDNYAIFKKQYISTKVTGYDGLLNSKVDLVIETKLYVVKKVHNNVVTLSEPGSSVNFKSNVTRIQYVDKMEKVKQKELLEQYLNRVRKEYEFAESSKNERVNSMDYVVFMKDSIYENIYSPIRNQLTKSWLMYGDSALLATWFRFLGNSRYGDDALDAKFLTICFLKRPVEFSTLLKKGDIGIKNDIFNYMLSSSGFMLATYELKKDFEKSKALFHKLLN